MNLEILDEFCMMTKFGNLSEAAKELHVTQPVLSRHLSMLENEAGFALLDRSTTPMQLTAGGEAFLSHASTIVCEYHRLRDHMAQLRRHPIETIRIGGALGALASPLIRATKNRLEQEQTNLSVKLSPLEYQTSLELVRNHQLDIAFEPYSTLIDVHGLESLPVIQEPSYILLPADHPLANLNAITPAELESMDFVYPISNRYHAVRKHLQGLCKKYALLGDVPKSLQPINVESLEEMVLGGLGDYATMLPESIALSYANMPNFGYVAIPFTGEGADYDLRAFFSEEGNRATRQFIEVLKDVLEEQNRAN